MAGFILRGLIAALGLWAATEMLDGFTINSPWTLVGAGLLLGVVNAAMLGLVALMLPGFKIAGFWTAVGGALIVSIVSWIGSWFIGSRGRVEVIRPKH
jgi:putative membrane protein